MAVAQDIFGMTLDKLEGFSRGELLSATKLTTVVRTINRNSAQLRPPEQVRPQPSAGIIVAMFSIWKVYQDHLLCRTWDGTDRGESNIEVLKPWELRKTPFHNSAFDGINYVYTSAVNAQSRVATLAEDAEDQVIVPTYVGHEFTASSASIIFAIRNVIGGMDDDIDAFAKKADWMDMNFAARAWAKESA